MTKRDFRVRRGLFRGQIRSRHDFDSFRNDYKGRKRGGFIKWIFLTLIVLITIALAYWLGG